MRQKLVWQHQCLRNFERSQPVVSQTHGLVVHPSVQVTLQREELPHVVIAPHRPVVRHEHDRCLVGEHLHVFVDVLRPVECVAHESAANWHQIVHGLRTVFGHAQPAKIREEEIHFGWRFGFWCQLENDANTIDH